MLHFGSGSKNVPWYELLDEQRLNEPRRITVNAHLCAELKSKAEKLFDKECEMFVDQLVKQNDSTQRFMSTIMKSGTVNDKIAALTLAIRDSPLHRVRSIGTLINVARKNNRDSRLATFQALCELLTSTVLPDRKLRRFAESFEDYAKNCDKGASQPSERHLILWIFEDQLKSLVHDFYSLLEVTTKDTIEHVRKKALGVAFDLLVAKPESEAMLLSILCNKLGDIEKRVCAKALHLLLKLLEPHPAMKSVVVDEVERVIFRENSPVRAQYYGVLVLSQLRFIRDSDSALAKKVIDVYLALFKVCAHKNELDSRLLGAILAGISRALPYAPHVGQNWDEHFDTLYKIVFRSDLLRSVQALSILFQLTVEHRGKKFDQFFNALYRIMMSADFGRGHASFNLMIHLLLRALRADKNDHRLLAFVKRLLQVSLGLESNFACGALLLVAELVEAKPVLQTFMMLSGKARAQDDEHASKETEAATHITSPPAADDSSSSSSSSSSSPSSSSAPSSSSSSSSSASASSSAPRKQEDFQIPQNITLDGDKGVTSDTADRNGSVSSAALPTSGNEKKRSPSYDVYNADPRFAHAERTFCWELALLASSQHPTVATFASKLLAGEKLSYKGNPIEDFSQTTFLDRFSFRNPRQLDKALQKVRSSKESGHRPMRLRRSLFEKAANADSRFLDGASKSVRAEERYLQQYFLKEREAAAALDSAGRRSKKKARVSSEDPTDVEIDTTVDLPVDEDLLDDDVEFDYDDLPQALDENLADEDLEMRPWLRQGSSAQQWADSILAEEAEQKEPAHRNPDGLRASPFAAAEDFAALLEQSGREFTDVSDKQIKWESRNQQRTFRKKKRKRK